MKKLLILLPFLLPFLLAACAGPVTMAPQGSRQEILQETQRQRELVFERMTSDQMRLSNVAFPLLAANAEFCGPKTTPFFGMTAWNLETIDKDYRRAAAGLYGVDNRLRVKAVAPNSPAAAAGVKAGDLIIAINGEALPEGAGALKLGDRLLKDAGYQPSKMAFERNGAPLTATLKPARGCDYPVLLDFKSHNINAFADGKRIVISKGMMRFVENDNELAMVLAHELGHNVMQHVNKTQQNAAVGMLGGLAIDGLLAAAGVQTNGQFGQIGGEMGGGQNSVAFEQEADYVGMYFMARAGYNTAGVADLWRRMGAEGESAINVRTSHPASAERFIAIERTHQEILGKKKRGQPLAPNMQR